MRRLLAGMALLPALAAAGCAEESRYRVLSFFFDGVPPPGAAAGPEAAAAAPAPAPGAPQTGSVAVSRHEPYRQRECDACHEAGSNALVDPVPTLCLNCHEIDLRGQKHIHGPLAAGACLVCHSPHTSPNPTLLITKVPGLCLFCHDREGIPADEAHQAAEPPCLDCHATHADNRYFLRPDRYPDAGGAP